MGAKQSDQSNVNYFQLKAKTSENDPTPMIRKSENIGGKWELTKTFNSIDGRLKEITWGTYLYEKQTKHKCKMKLVDLDGTVNVLESNFNNLLYGILNSFAGIENFGMINIDVWLGKSKEGSDKRYASAGVKNNDEKAPWKYNYADLPKPVMVTVGSKTVEDDTECVEFWKKEIEAINARLPKMDAGLKATNANDIPDPEGATKAPESVGAPVNNEPTDDLPF